MLFVLFLFLFQQTCALKFKLISIVKFRCLPNSTYHWVSLGSYFSWQCSFFAEMHCGFLTYRTSTPQDTIHLPVRCVYSHPRLFVRVAPCRKLTGALQLVLGHHQWNVCKWTSRKILKCAFADCFEQWTGTSDWFVPVISGFVFGNSFRKVTWPSRGLCEGTVCEGICVHTVFLFWILLTTKSTLETFFFLF
jgi:hypothetical protein